MTILEEIISYSNDVIEGKIIACQKNKWACMRFLKDIERVGSQDFPYVFSEKRANHFLVWMTLFKHTKGPLAGKYKIPEPIEKFVFGNLFGWVHKSTGYRRFRIGYWQVAKKNAKSQDLAITGLYGTAADGEPYAENYVAASKKEQTRYVWGEADIISQNSEYLKNVFKTKYYEPVLSKVILHEKSGSFFQRLSSEDKKHGDGGNPHFGIIDEYHQHETAEHRNNLENGMITRRQPLLMIITTAGTNLNSPCYRVEYKYASEILDPNYPEVENDQYFAMINELDTDAEGNLIDDINDESCWPKANPIVTKTPEGRDSIRMKVKAANDKPEELTTVLTKTFNIWVNKGEAAYLNYNKWKAAGTGKLRMMPRDLSQYECYIGVDLTSRLDLASVSFVFDLPNGYEVELPNGSKFIMPSASVAVKSHSFMPEATYNLRMKSKKYAWDTWKRQEHISVVPGEVLDDRFVSKYIDDTVKLNRWNAKYIGYDMYNATQFANVMQDDYGYAMVIVRQGIPTLHEPTKVFREYLYAGQVIHEDDPILNLAAKNAVIRQDHNKNMMLDKEKSTENIDPLAATMNGMTFIVRKPEKKSIYETRGMRSLA